MSRTHSSGKLNMLSNREVWGSEAMSELVTCHGLSAYRRNSTGHLLNDWEIKTTKDEILGHPDAWKFGL
jgi:hypothetical protein